MLLAALAWAILINLWTLLRFWQDKSRAIAGQRRIPEAALLRLAALGGTPAAYAARSLFCHKTRKQPFSLYLLLIALAQIGLVTGLLILTSRP